MNLQDIQKAGELVKKLEDGLETQQAAIVDLRLSLDNYIEFLQRSMKELQDASER